MVDVEGSDKEIEHMLAKSLLCAGTASLAYAMVNDKETPLQRTNLRSSSELHICATKNVFATHVSHTHKREGERKGGREEEEEKQTGGQTDRQPDREIK